MKPMKAAKLGALAGTLALGLAACASSDGTVTPGSEANPQQEQLAPAEMVDASVARFDETSYTVSLNAGDVATGELTHDPGTATYHATTSVQTSLMSSSASGTVDAEVIGIGEDIWIRPSGDMTELADLSGTWVHTTADNNVLSFIGMDLKQLTDELLHSLSNVEQIDDNTYTAVIDGGNVTALPSHDPIEVTLVLDDQGRLVKMSGDMPHPTDSSQTVPVTLEVTGYDVPVSVEEPPADQTIELDDLFR